MDNEFMNYNNIPEEENTNSNPVDNSVGGEQVAEVKSDDVQTSYDVGQSNTQYGQTDTHTSQEQQYAQWQQYDQQYGQQYQNTTPRYNTYGTDYYNQDPQARSYTQSNTEELNKKVKKKKEPLKISRASLTILLVSTMIFSMFFGLCGGVIANNMSKKSNTAGLTINKVDSANVENTAVSTDYSTSTIADMTADSVVEIVTEVVQTSSFYQQYITSGAGSGVIISQDGYIVTNNHVIDGATKITVTLRNGNSYEAELIGTDSEFDVAIIKIEPDEEELTVAVFGDSSTIGIGDKAVIIGNPLGQLGGTVTVGIISALDRDVTIDGKTMRLLQTDAAINPGNSGGGMFNGKGELIGVVVAKSSGSEVEGLGFAIPINDVLDVLDDLMQYGYVRGRVSLGVSLVDVTSQQMAMMYGVSELGCYISSVELNSNASAAGLQSGDRIISINGQEIGSAEQVVEFMDTVSVGDTMEIKVARNGRTGTLSVVLQEDVPEGQLDDNNTNNFNNQFDSQQNDNYSQYGNDSNSLLEDLLNRFGF